MRVFLIGSLVLYNSWSDGVRSDGVIIWVLRVLTQLPLKLINHSGSLPLMYLKENNYVPLLMMSPVQGSNCKWENCWYFGVYMAGCSYQCISPTGDSDDSKVTSEIGDVTSSRVKLQMREMLLLLSLYGKLQWSYQWLVMSFTGSDKIPHSYVGFEGDGTTSMTLCPNCQRVGIEVIFCILYDE